MAPQCFLLTPGAIPYGILFKRDKLSSQDGTTVFLTDTGRHSVRYPSRMEQAVPRKAPQCFLQTPGTLYGIRSKQNKLSPGKHHDVSY